MKRFVGTITFVAFGLLMPWLANAGKKGANSPERLALGRCGQTAAVVVPYSGHEAGLRSVDEAKAQTGKNAVTWDTKAVGSPCGCGPSPATSTPVTVASGDGTTMRMPIVYRTIDNSECYGVIGVGRSCFADVSQCILDIGPDGMNCYKRK
jgi:hypothetical protein